MYFGADLVALRFWFISFGTSFFFSDACSPAASKGCVLNCLLSIHWQRRLCTCMPCMGRGHGLSATVLSARDVDSALRRRCRATAFLGSHLLALQMSS
jgi:hypothetical protein